MSDDELVQAILALQDRVRLLHALHSPTLGTAQASLRRLVAVRLRRADRARQVERAAAAPAAS